MEPRSNIEKPKDRKVKRHGNNRNKKKQKQKNFENGGVEIENFSGPMKGKKNKGKA